MRKFWLVALFVFLLTGCYTQVYEGGLNRTNFAEFSSNKCVYRMQFVGGKFTAGQKLDFVFSIANESDQSLSYDLRDRRFLFIYLKNPDNKVFYKERILSDRFFPAETLVIPPQTTVKYNISLKPELSEIDTISAIYCQTQLLLLSKGQDYNRLSFFVKRK